jgi:lipopolysaccharide/colanic/teichoic acid biosynthesis glycosyltransferase
MMQLDPVARQELERHPSYQSPRLTSLGQPVTLYAEVAPWQRSMKRAADIAISAVALLCFALALPLLALIIRLDSRGPVFYSQARVGINRRNRDRRRRQTRDEVRERRASDAGSDRRHLLAEGRPFTIHKLRTMYVDAESDGVRWAEKGDPRITRVGRFLRKSRLDEFPQFLNVLRGDMSVVGPRPERPPFITLLSAEVPGYLDRLRFKPGITGLSQVEIGYDTSVESVEQKVAHDLEYIIHFSLRRDLKILGKTFGVVLTGKGAC